MVDGFNPLDPVRSEFWMRLGTAILCGGIIGLERQLRGKAAGIRTSILICLGTELFVGLGSSFGGERVDPTRVLGQVVTGIGFLGAGVILAREGAIVGVTSAAVIWVLAALGSLVGLGHLRASIILTLVTVGLLTGVELLESVFRRLREGATERELDRIDLRE
jgi:putative Mg2+ transporter-C (MgtC) family protein